MARRVHPEPPALDRRAGLGGPRRGVVARAEAAAPQQRTDAGNQQSQAERLGDVIVRAHLEAGFLVALVVLAGEEDHGERGTLANAAQQLHPIHPRHLDVEHREVGRIFVERLQRCFAVRIDAGGESFGLERDRNRGEDVAVVVDQRDRTPIASLPFLDRRLLVVHGGGISPKWHAKQQKWHAKQQTAELAPGRDWAGASFDEFRFGSYAKDRLRTTGIVRRNLVRSKHLASHRRDP